MKPHKQRVVKSRSRSPPAGLIDKREIELIKQQHLGHQISERRRSHPNDKKKEEFNDQWDESEDTMKN